MNKKITFIALHCFLFICFKKEEVGVPRIANGKINNMLLLSMTYYGMEVGDSARNKFVAPVLGLLRRNCSLILISIP
jgi:hypothetical protein